MRTKEPQPEALFSPELLKWLGGIKSKESRDREWKIASENIMRIWRFRHGQ